MDFYLNILDYTGLKEENGKSIKRFIECLKSVGLYLNISYKYDDLILETLVNKYLNDLSIAEKSVISNIKFQMDLNDYRNTNGTNDMYIIISETIPTGQNLWGEAIEGFVSVIKYPHEKNIWHEIAHLFGAKDHYDHTSKVDTCSDLNCIMQYGKTEGGFCSKTLHEIKSFVISVQNNENKN